jgi:hypothetical protein
VLQIFSSLLAFTYCGLTATLFCLGSEKKGAFADLFNPPLHVVVSVPVMIKCGLAIYEPALLLLVAFMW